MSSLFIITGPNGAGKSAVGATYLPERIQERYSVFDGDKISLQKKKELFPGEIRSLKEARKAADEWMFKEFDEQVKQALKANDHFAYEGHFREKSTLITPRRFKRKGYFLSLIFMGLANPQQSELRVIDRAKHGGHYVPPYEIELNFYGNLEMLNRNYKLFDELLVIDTSESLRHQVLLHYRKPKIVSFTPIKDQPAWFIKFLPNLVRLIKAEGS
jgi:predicted ABC-type ATPase